ncbi:MAG: anhydro-N-acetylmuramic acid kinase [Candidatus Omnitrophica bacterium]|nr:anhydro-N-acetylmuramic acid kinase [Candidatus Omnitrophota bacterium]
MKQLAVGLMSGTSGDGASLALAEFQNDRVKVLDYKTYPYPSGFSQKILNASTLSIAEISRLNIQLGNFFAKAILDFIPKSSRKSIRVIGSHGQTIYHGPFDNPPNTFQIGEPSVIAEQLGIPVVADFRMRDIACGGGGAPLMPFFDHYFFGNSNIRALQNIGGIGNVTVVGKNLIPIAFDTGPGNCLIDWAVRLATNGRKLYDRGGELASKGIINRKAVLEMAAHPYFKRKPPKSTGRELFNEKFVPVSLLSEKSADLVATLTYFTAHTIHESCKKFLPKNISEIIVSGGGALNLTLMKHLKKLFSTIPVTTIKDYGIHVQAKEPAAFAFFALKAIESEINHLPAGTGAKKAAVLGKIIPIGRPADQFTRGRVN